MANYDELLWRHVATDGSEFSPAGCAQRHFLGLPRFFALYNPLLQCQVRFEHGMGVGPKSKIDEESWEKNGKMGVSGRVCWYVACYDFVLGFNVSSLVLMIFQVGFWGSF